MHCHGLVFSDDPDRLMNSLIANDRRNPADVWTPMEVETSDGRSGWHTLPSQYRIGDSSGYGQAVHCVWPTVFLREHLGPHALLPDSALSLREVPRGDVTRRGGEWFAKLPRFFETIGVHWSATHESQWQGHQFADAARGATVGSLDLDYNLKTHDPNLLVGPNGPVFFQAPGSSDLDVVRRRREAASLLMRLPKSTPVTLVSWHDTDRTVRWGRDWQLPQPEVDSDCACFRSEWEYSGAYSYGRYPAGTWLGGDA